MPELSRFFGIIIYMYPERDAPHHTPHFHAVYQEHTAVFGIDQVDRIAGELPRRQHRLVVAWAELHQSELQANWERLHAGQPAERVAPLK